METEILTPFLNRAGAFDPAGWFQLVPKGSFPIARKEGDAVKTYLQVVDDQAVSSGHVEVDGEHLLWALLDQAEGLVPRTFAKWERRLRRKEGTKGQVVEVPAPLNGGGPWAVEVDFPHGVRLRRRG